MHFMATKITTDAVSVPSLGTFFRLLIRQTTALLVRRVTHVL